MKKILMTAIVVSMSTVASYAGGWGGGSNSLINVSPSVDLGDVTALNGILNGNAILNGNNVSDVLNGNQTGVGNGILSGIGVGILSGNSYKLRKH